MKARELSYYGILSVVLVVSIIYSYLYRGNIGTQMMVGAGTSVFYVVWGIYFHKESGELHRKIVLEYVLIGLIAIVLLLTLAI